MPLSIKSPVTTTFFSLFFLIIRIFNNEIRRFFVTLNIEIRNLADKCGIIIGHPALHCHSHPALHFALSYHTSNKFNILEKNSFKLSVDHVLSQISDLDRCANIFSIVVFFTVLLYDMLAIILSAIVMKSAIVKQNCNYICQESNRINW